MAKEYAWSDRQDDEVWRGGRFDSIKECIKDAIGSGKVPGEQIAVGICEDYTPSIDVDDILDRVGENAYEEVGEVAEGWPCYERGKGYTDADKLSDKINEVFAEWLKETGQTPGFYKIIPLADMVTIPEGKV